MERLLRNTRRNKIQSLIEERGYMRVVDVAALLGVTDETIRGDLKALAKTGKVLKVHGGAESPNRQSGKFVPLSCDKPEFARKVLDMINGGDLIYLDGSTSALTVAQLLPDIEITVYTNSPRIMNCLLNRERIVMVGVGGRFDPAAGVFLGDHSRMNLGRSLFDLAVFSCSGVSLEHGLLDKHEGQAAFLSEVLSRTLKKVVMADTSQLGARSKFGVWNKTDDVTIVTDVARDSALVLGFESQGYDVVVVSGSPDGKDAE